MVDSLLDRRSVLKASGVATVATVGLAVGTAPAPAAAAVDATFAHGVASGDPLPDAVLLWTRVTPTPGATPGSGVGPEVDVTWEVATDPAFAAVVASGTARTGPDRDHTVKVDATGLAPATTYHYRFHLGGAVSTVGTTRTAPAATAAVSRLRFGVVSCSNWQEGHFAAYRYLAERGDLDAVLHLGDYLYEYGAATDGVRRHVPAHEMVSLADYRRRHAQYKTDEHLQRLHASVPVIATWDDHEVANDAWSGGAENHQPATEGDYAARRARAHRAYFEWMPVRNQADRLYRRLRFGLLAELSMLDLRSYRSQQVPPFDDGVDDPDRTMTGAAQLAWLRDGLVGSDAQWKLVGNSVMVAPVLVPPLPADLLGPLLELLGLPREGGVINPDQWDGYAADRRLLLDAIADTGVRDTVFLTGDIHSSWASDVPRDAGLYPLSPSVATEFVCTSVTSDNIDDIAGVPPRTVGPVIETALTTLNRHVQWVEVDSHGASVLEVTPAGAQMDWYFLANKADPASTLTHARSYRVRAGTQRVRRVGSPIGN
ncbi:alkaline phosphatase D family protein [Actinophytocola gossypii]|uniref:Alkaline phosphatase D family protein n=1 Tax=Actinophytocola gossypii TaxID=2812003 RepID=A0ABT2JE67_9PSEU|nr:alkaline phosphatase D family protein [Actinophytocola gossypii]MCT2586016.1 alkaline phosphatase D family protein [Actinophytocola gossypii]